VAQIIIVWQTLKSVFGIDLAPLKDRELIKGISHHLTFLFDWMGSREETCIVVNSFSFLFKS
jgi:hypothetical protein